MSKAKKGPLPTLEATYQMGVISIENLPENNYFNGNLGVQLAADGRVWVCIDGQAFLRFTPSRKQDG